MPVEFLSDEEAAAYGRFIAPPSREELERSFFLDDADRTLIARHRGEYNRLGFALQLTTVRSLGLFLVDPRDVPGVVLDYLAGQLEITDPSCVARYMERRTTRFEHAEEIKRARGLRDFTAVARELETWVDARAWTTSDGPRAIFNDAIGWLFERGVLLPGVTTLARLVARVRDEATERLWDALSGLLTRGNAGSLSVSWRFRTAGGSRISSVGARVRRSRRAGIWRRRLRGSRRSRRSSWEALVSMRCWRTGGWLTSRATG